VTVASHPSRGTSGRWRRYGAELVIEVEQFCGVQRPAVVGDLGHPAVLAGVMAFLVRLPPAVVPTAATAAACTP
jgi:hypothetical protein